ncbi:hypothetical protein LSM04_008777 [Trypanosoma melophagium]|uniref:uncharacterized protein n=1 Tax=Trypanosoma melophagium TaxID=715481 RepID=UPI00351A49F4|nr:hypothetical protein LSM04_008777 [Trypanosoma melophagium]
MPPLPAKGRAAQSFLAARGAPESLQSFLDGIALPARSGADDAAMIEVNLKLLQKSNETTVLKALTELNRQVAVVPVWELISYISVIVEAVIRHAEHANASVRAGVFTLLHGVIQRGEELQQELMRRLPSLAVVWVARMNDMETTVRKDAREAFNAAFSPEILQKYADLIVDGLIDAYKEVIEESRGKALQDDNLDKRSNALYSYVCALGYMMRQPVAAREKIITFVEKKSLLPVMPLQEGNVKGSLVAKTPVVRSASLSLLRDIVESGRLTPQIHQCISIALYDAMKDDNVVVIRRTWELLLLWCGDNAQTAIGYFHDGFLSNIIDSFMRCNDSSVAEVIYPSLVPLLVPLTRDSRCANAVDEFSDALVQKLSHIVDAGAQEWGLVLSAVLRLWELLCVRTARLEQKEQQEQHEKENENEEMKCVKLFRQIITTLATAMNTSARQLRYLQITVSVVAQSMTRIARHQEYFNECVHTLCDQTNAQFFRQSCNESTAFKDSFNMIQAGVMGAIATIPGVSTEAEQLVEKYTICKLWKPLLQFLRMTVNNDKTYDGSCFIPSKSTQLKVTRGLMEGISSSRVKGEVNTKKEKEEVKNVNEIGEEDNIACFEELLSLVLQWKDIEIRDEVQKLVTNMDGDLEWVRESIRKHDMKDPERLISVFLQACEDADFRTLECCVNALESQQRIILSKEKERLRHAVQISLQNTLRLIAAESEEETVLHDGAKSTSSHSSDGHSDKSTEKDDDEAEEKDNSESETQSDADDDDDIANEGGLVLERLVTWADLLRKGARLAVLLNFSCDDFELPILFRIVAGVSPPLHPEQYMSIKALRVALQETEDPLLLAMSRKTHSLGVSQFNILIEHVEEWMDSYEVSVERRDTASLELFDEVMRDTSCALAACGQVTRLLPFASCALLQGIACSAELWSEHEVRLRESKTSADDVPFAMLDRYCSLDRMELSMLRCIRTAQLVHLLGVSVPIETCDTVTVILPLLRAARVQEAMADPIRKLLMTKLLPRALLCLNSDKEILSLLSSDAEPHLLICTLAGIIRDVVIHANNVLVDNARRIASVITEWILDALFIHNEKNNNDKNDNKNKIPAPMHPAAVAAYRAFFASLDEAADVIGDSILSNVGTRARAALQEAMCMLPTLELRHALLIMTLHRHLNNAPVVVASTVHQLITYARSQRPLDALELLSEFTSSRINDAAAYTELVHDITHMLARCYRLRHMPPNGRLVTQSPNDVPISSRDLRRVVVSAVSARRGANLHGRIDDVLRSSVHLVLFDAVAECVVSLRQTKEDEVPLVTKLIAFTSNCLSELITSDVSVIRASEVSVTKVASVMNYAYQWLCATSIARLENIGMDTVTSAIRAVALLSNLTLMRSNFVLLPIMRQITSKRTLKNLRNELSVRSPAKLNVFMRNTNIIAKTNKQKLALFPHLLAWCITLTGPVNDSMAGKQRDEVFHLLDLLSSLLLTPAVPGNKRLDGTYLCTSVKLGGENLGFETAALTRPNATNPMKELAKGAAAVFALLLQGNTLSLVKSWLETIERKLQDSFFTFVEDHVSPFLIQESLLAVLAKSPSGETTFDVNENYTISVSLAKHLITLKYTMEDASVTVKITFPTAFPLRLPTVTFESGRDCGVSTERWRAWMLKMTVLLFGGSANVWECVTLFGRNMDAHFAGHEPCPICFAVVSAISHRLPDMRCAVCRNSALHSDCLYAWWANSGQTVCPLCRSPWVES